MSVSDTGGLATGQTTRRPVPRVIAYWSLVWPALAGGLWRYGPERAPMATGAERVAPNPRCGRTPATTIEHVSRPLRERTGVH
jgi:hypothetical protein